MASGKKSSIRPSKPSNAFDPSFLRRLGERDEPPTGGEADVVGPWRIPGEGFGPATMPKREEKNLWRRFLSPKCGLFRRFTTRTQANSR